MSCRTESSVASTVSLLAPPRSQAKLSPSDLNEICRRISRSTTKDVATKPAGHTTRGKVDECSDAGSVGRGALDGTHRNQSLGPLEDWANQCAALRDDLIRLALHHVLAVLVSPRKHQRVFRTPFPPRMRGAFFCRRRPGYAAPPRPLFGSCGRPP